MENNDIRKFCPYCGVQNDPSYSFCKNCGKPLGVQSAQAFNTGAAYGNEINDIPVAEVADYIGKNSDRYIPKFFRFSRGSKADWNWPVFLFGLLGIPFVWFFHRKMYKWGSILLSISVAISIATACMIGSVFSFIKEPIIEVVEDTIEIAEENYDDRSDEFIMTYDMQKELEEKYTDIFDDILESDELVSISLLSNLLSVVNLVYLIIVPIFANFLYYRKAFDDLRRINGSGTITPEIVKSSGGTSPAASALSGIFSYLAIQFIMCIPFITFFVDILSKFTDL